MGLQFEYARLAVHIIDSIQPLKRKLVVKFMLTFSINIILLCGFSSDCKKQDDGYELWDGKAEEDWSGQVSFLFVTAYHDAQN